MAHQEDVFAKLFGGVMPEATPQRKALIKAVRFIRDGGDVKRYHVIPRIVEEKVGQHSFGVAWWAFLLSDHRPSANLLLACLAHDLPEGKFGDMPGDYKDTLGSIFKEEIDGAEEAALAKHGLVFSLTFEEALILKFADNLDGYCSCMEERTMGNYRIYLCFGNYRDRIVKMLTMDGIRGTRFGAIGAELFDILGGNIGAH